MFYIRKLSKPTNLFKIKNIGHACEIEADFLYQDMRTSGNTLSVWRTDSLEGENLKNAINAALFASSEIVKTQFIILDFNSLSEVGIITDDTQPGITGYRGLESLHTNLCNLDLNKIKLIIELYRKASFFENRIPKVENDEFKGKFKSVTT